MFYFCKISTVTVIMDKRNMLARIIHEGSAQCGEIRAVTASEWAKGLLSYPTLLSITRLGV